MVLHALAAQGKELFNQVRQGDDGGARIKGEAVLLVHIGAAAGCIQFFQHLHAVAFDRQANGCGQAAKAGANHYGCGRPAPAGQARAGLATVRAAVAQTVNGFEQKCHAYPWGVAALLWRKAQRHRAVVSRGKTSIRCSTMASASMVPTSTAPTTWAWLLSGLDA